MSVEVGDDLKDMMMMEVVEEKVGGGGGVEGGEGEEEEDVYFMEVSDELEKRNEVVVKEVELMVVVVVFFELDKNDDFLKEEDVMMSMINDELMSELGVVIERGLVEILFVELVVGVVVVVVFEKEDVMDFNEILKFELENESEEMRVNEVSLMFLMYDFVEVVEELEVL